MNIELQCQFKDYIERLRGVENFINLEKLPSQESFELSLKNEIKESIDEGIRLLQPLNPSLTSLMQKRLVERAWRVHCSPDLFTRTSNLAYAGLASRGTYWNNKYVIDIGHFGFVHLLYSFSEIRKRRIKSNIDQEREKSFFQQIVFHEALHYLSHPDTLLPHYHTTNLLALQGDLVQACALLAFPLNLSRNTHRGGKAVERKISKIFDFYLEKLIHNQKTEEQNLKQEEQEESKVSIGSSENARLSETEGSFLRNWKVVLEEAFDPVSRMNQILKKIPPDPNYTRMKYYFTKEQCMSCRLSRWERLDSGELILIYTNENFDQIEQECEEKAPYSIFDFIRQRDL